MKKIALNIFALGMIAAGFTACDDAKNDAIDNMVYISEAGAASGTEIVLGTTGEESTMGLTVRMAQVAEKDTKVTLTMSQEALDAYNKRNDTELAMIPAEYIDFPSEVVIPAGSSAATVNVKVTSFNGESGVDYAAPITIVSADGQVVAQGSKSYIVTLGKALVQKAPGFISSNAMKMNFDETVKLNSFTLEWWARVANTAGTGGYTINNQAIFSFQANKEIYIRFGDVVYTVNGRSVYNFLQIKFMGKDANFDTGDPNKNPLQWGTWYHYALTYDGATGDALLYQNGNVVNSMNGGAHNWEIDGLNLCSAGSYHRDVIELAQVRMWNTCRNEAQIKKYYKKEVKYTDPNLVFYLPMNEGEGDTLHDVTGNGHDVVIGSNGGSRNTAYSWNEVKF